MRAYGGLILLTLCLLLAEKSAGSVQALHLDRILGIVDRFSQMGGSGVAKEEVISEDKISETEKLAEEEDRSPDLLIGEEDADTESIDRTHHQHQKHKAPIIATKTVFLQVTKHVTRHPVCMTVHGVKPPCLPAELAGGHHVHHGGVHEPQWWGREDIWADGMQEEGLYIEPSATVRISTPTATVEFSDSHEEEEDEEGVTVEPSSRSGRYLEVLNRETPAPPSTTASSVINDQPESEDRHLGSLMHKHHKKDHKYVTKTLVVTKVLPVTDYRVTATLEAKNCIPHDVKIPFCPAPHAPHIPLSPLHPIVHGLPEETIEEHEEVHHPVKPPHKPIFNLPIKPPHKPIFTLPLKPPHKPIFEKPEHHEPVHHEPVHPPHHEKPTKPIIPIISSILHHKPSKPVAETQHFLDAQGSDEVFDPVDETLKASDAPIEQ